MIKTILVPALGDDGDEAAFATALAAARPFAAHLAFLHMRLDPVDLLTAAAGGDMGTGMALPSLLEDFEKQGRERAERARAGFDRLCRRAKLAIAESPTREAGLSAEWREITGDVAQGIVGAARFHDLVVLPSGASRGSASIDDAGAVLVGAGRPLLIAPAEPPAKLPGTVVIAWKERIEASRAVAAAMPFLAEAGKIEVLNVAEGRATEGGSVQAVVRQLKWHGFKATGRSIDPRDLSPAEALLAAAQEARAGLLVAGGYGHSRVRELIFGGFTQRVLEGVGLPVLLMH
jgi:nucleotide-binding universal stress UspA family protein